MRTNIAVLPAKSSAKGLAQSLRSDDRHGQRLYPVVDDEGRLSGVITRGDLRKFLQEHPVENGAGRIADLVRSIPATAFPDEPLRVVVHRMAETGLTRLPVVQRNDSHKLVGMVSLDDLLKARVQSLDAERRRERFLTIRQFLPPHFRAREKN